MGPHVSMTREERGFSTPDSALHPLTPAHTIPPLSVPDLDNPEPWRKGVVHLKTLKAPTDESQESHFRLFWLGVVQPASSASRRPGPRLVQPASDDDAPDRQERPDEVLLPRG